MIKPIYFTNTLSRTREVFKPADPSNVRFYACGPTVYGLLHIGNGRAMVVADLIYRFLRYAGYGVTFVRNYTDVDDKIITLAAQEGVTSDAIAQRYIEECERDMQALNLLPPNHTVKVTDSIPDIISMIERIIQRGLAYVVDGEVLFAVEKSEHYGKLSGRDLEGLQAGARVEVDQKKRNPLDFALWKPRKSENPAEPFWNSPWGEGRPGWHIECSAMIMKWLGETIDLHHGGIDLVFPHHENEIAQSEAATGKPFCGHWMHHALLNFGNEKMSKSLGNILTIRDFLNEHPGEILKFLFVSVHYRSEIEFSRQTIRQVYEQYERILKLKEWAREIVQTHPAPSNGVMGDGASKWQQSWSKTLLALDTTMTQIDTEMAHDLNNAGALGHLFTLIRLVNDTEAASQRQHKEFSQDAQAQALRVLLADRIVNKLFVQLDSLWGLFVADAHNMLTSINTFWWRENEIKLSLEDAEKLLQERQSARANKDFARADAIRKELEGHSIEILDSATGSKLRAKRFLEKHGD
jgi:cysteinyl-tRNA synthetase